MIWFGILIGFLIAFVLGFFINSLNKNLLNEKYFLGAYHCNHCERSIREEDAKYCAFCGRRLTLHRDNPLYKEYALERPNNLFDLDNHDEEN